MNRPEGLVLAAEPRGIEVSPITRRQALGALGASLAVVVSGGVGRYLIENHNQPPARNGSNPNAFSSKNERNGEIPDEEIERVFDLAGQRLQKTADEISPGKSPYYTDKDGHWEKYDSPRGWTGGFWVGCLWSMYERTGDKKWQELADAWAAPLAHRGEKSEVGFVVMPSFVKGFELTHKEQYRQSALSATASLIKEQYNPKIGAIGAFGRWPNRNSQYAFRPIIDNSLTMPLLFWAAQQPGGKKEWADMAESHLQVTMKNFIRKDGSVYQDVNFDPNTGKVIDKYTIQGYEKWSRGVAWWIGGAEEGFKYTRNKEFLEAARKTADYFIKNLPDDHVPFWDFEAPGIPDAPKDSSAAAIAAYYLLELSTLDPDKANQEKYFKAAEDILTSLMSPKYLAKKGDALLKHATQAKKRGSYDTGLIYADYYFLQALLRYQEITK